jgi:predicted nucleic acid-binding protein
MIIPDAILLIYAHDECSPWHAFEHSATIYSNDRDFDRFSGIRRVNPLK